MTKKIANVLIFFLLASFLSLSLIFFSQHAHSNFLDYKLESLLPSYAQSEAIQSFRKKFHDQVIITLEHSSNKPLTNTIQEVKNSLEQTQALELIELTKPDLFSKFYFNHRYIYDLPQELQCIDLCTQETMDQYVENALFNPFNGITSMELKYDPFLAVRNIMQSSKQATNYAFDEEQNLYIQDQGKRYYLLQYQLNNNITNDQIEKLNATFKDLKNKLMLEKVAFSYTGEIFFAHSAKESSVNDLTYISIFSVVTLILLYALTFNSIKPLIITLLALSITLLFNFLLVVDLFGSIHVMTLALGATLIGICVDYYIHLFFALMQKSHEKSALLKPLFISLITSLLAYIIMSFTSLIVLKELAIFAIGSLFTTYLIVAILLTYTKCDLKKKEKGRIYKLINKLIHALAHSSPKINFSILIAILFIGFFTIKNINPNDDVAKMQNKDLSLYAMDQRIKALLNSTTNLNWYMINSDKLEDSLQICEELITHITSSNTFLPCELLPSNKRQEQNLKQYQLLYPLLKNSYLKQKITLNDQDISINTHTLIHARDLPINIDFMFDQTAVLIKVDAQDQELISLLHKNEHIEKIDPHTKWNNAFKSFRTHLNKIFLIALSLSILILIPFFKKLIIKQYMLPMLIGISLGIIAQFYINDGYFNLFTTLALFMILGLGADYCIMLANTTLEALNSKVHTLIITLLTTEMSFGILGTSDIPVISSFGVVLSFGLLGVFLTNLVLFLNRFEDQI